MAEKQCTKCGEVKSLEDFAKDRSKRDGCRPYCRSCERARVAKYHEDNATVIAGRNQANRERVNAAKRRRYAEQLERNREHARHKRALRAEAANASAQQWKRDNPERTRQQRALYYASHKQLEKDRAILRKALCKQAVPLWFEADKVREVYRQAEQRDLQVDHIVPLISKKVCGLHCWHNLQLLDGPLNTSKGNRHWPDM